MIMDNIVSNKEILHNVLFVRHILDKFIYKWNILARLIIGGD